LGSLEGGHSFALAALPHIQEVTAVEGRLDNLRRAQFVQGLLQQPKVRFVRGNLETFSLASLGRFDVALCLGVLYHLPEPWKLIDQLSRVTPALFVWTHYASPEQARQRRHRYRGRIYREWLFFFEALSGLSPGSFWPGRDDLVQMLGDSGFTQTTVIEDDPGHRHGPAITLVARQA
jgi:SAM-dependent methyltransferase